MSDVEVCAACAGRGVVPPERTCANETCRRLFRWADDQPGTGRHTTGVMYCSSSCAKAQAQREYRRRESRKATS